MTTVGSVKPVHWYSVAKNAVVNRVGNFVRRHPNLTSIGVGAVALFGTDAANIVVDNRQLQYGLEPAVLLTLALRLGRWGGRAKLFIACSGLLGLATNYGISSLPWTIPATSLLIGLTLSTARFFDARRQMDINRDPLATLTAEAKETGKKSEIS